MRFFNGVCILLAVLLVLSYLIARPHLGTMWTLNTTTVVNMTPISRKWPYPYATFSDCERRAEAFHSDHGGVALASCVPETRRLWGW